MSVEVQELRQFKTEQQTINNQQEMRITQLEQMCRGDNDFKFEQGGKNGKMSIGGFRGNAHMAGILSYFHAFYPNF